MNIVIAGVSIFFAAALAAVSAPALAQTYAPPYPPAARTIEVAAESQAECLNCAPSKNYDSVEVIRNVREVDHSRVIETTSVVPMYRSAPERALRLVDAPPVTIVHFVTHEYPVLAEPAVSYGEFLPPRRLYRDRGHSWRGCRPLRVRW